MLHLETKILCTTVCKSIALFRSSGFGAMDSSEPTSGCGCWARLFRAPVRSLQSEKGKQYKADEDVENGEANTVESPVGRGFDVNTASQGEAAVEWREDNPSLYVRASL